MKRWSHQYLQNYNVISNDMFVPLNKVQSEKADFDVVAKIVQIHDLDEYTNELKLKDSSNTAWNTLALKLKFPNLKTGDVVRVRSVLVDETSHQKKVLNLSHYSNILTFPSHSKINKDVKAKVHDEKPGAEKGAKAKLQYSPVVLTEIEKKH